jgi:predicted nucleic-acid-binding protein
MKITADTNLLVRAVVDDDVAQSARAREALAGADLVALTPAALCEFVWVLRRGYGVPHPEIARTIRALLSSDTVAADTAAAQAGLVHLDAGGDFADGVIAHEGRWLGADTFLSFDKQAVRLVRAAGLAAREPG